VGANESLLSLVLPDGVWPNGSVPTLGDECCWSRGFRSSYWPFSLESPLFERGKGQPVSHDSL
jgi:hypothetical protein